VEQLDAQSLDGGVVGRLHGAAVNPNNSGALVLQRHVTMTRPLLAVGLLAVVIVGGVTIGMVHAFSEEIGLDW